MQGASVIDYEKTLKALLAKSLSYQTSDIIVQTADGTVCQIWVKALWSKGCQGSCALDFFAPRS